MPCKAIVADTHSREGTMNNPGVFLGADLGADIELS